VLVRDLCELYAAHTGGRAPRLPALPIQYPDYAAWQRRQLADGQLRHCADYWRSQLADLPPALRPRAPRHQQGVTATGHTQRFTLDARARTGLAALAQQQGATLFMVLMAAFDVLLSAYSGRDDIVVTYPEAGRERPETADLVGFFVEHLAVRADLTGAPTFRELIGQVRRKVVDSSAYRGFPLADVAAATGGDPSRVVFNLLNASIPAVDLDGVRAAPLDTGGSYVFSEIAGNVESAQVDIALILREEGATLRGMWLYSLERIDARAMGAMIVHWERLIDLLVADPDRRVGDIRNLLTEERG
jgi:non-ribosomal peptide synthetase component F